MFYLVHPGDYLLSFHEGYMNNLSTIYCYAKFSTWYISTVIKFEGISSLTYNKMPPPFELRSSLYGVQKSSIKN